MGKEGLWDQAVHSPALLRCKDVSSMQALVMDVSLDGIHVLVLDS